MSGRAALGRRAQQLAAAGAVAFLTAALCLAVVIDEVDQESAPAADPITGRQLRQLLAAEAVPLVAPGWLPDGLSLTSAKLEPAQPAGGRCATVALRWEDTTAMAAADRAGGEDPAYPPELSLELSPAGCAASATGGEPFRAGPNRGRIVRPAEAADEPYSAVYLTIGTTRATVVSDLAERQLARVVRHLAPLSLDRG